MDKKNLNIINSIYTEATFTSKYGIDILITIIIVVPIFLIISYFNFINNLKSIKSNWEEEKCNPINFPFIPIINDDPNKTPDEQINENISNCISAFTEKIQTNTLGGVYQAVGSIIAIFSQFNEFKSFMHKIFVWILNALIFLMRIILLFIKRCFLASRHMIIIIQTFFDRIQAIIVTKFFMAMQIFNIFMGVVLNFAKIGTLILLFPNLILISTLMILIAIFTALAIMFFSTIWLIPLGVVAAGIATLFGMSLPISFIILFIILLLIMGLNIIENYARKFSIV